MSSFELHVIYGNTETEEWDVVDYLTISPYEELDFSKGVDFIKQAMADSWNVVSLPNDETIEIMTIFDPDQDNLTLNVRQGNTPVLQVMCSNMSSVCFRTLASKDVNLQVHSVGTFSTIKEAGNA